MKAGSAESEWDYDSFVRRSGEYLAKTFCAGGHTINPPAYSPAVSHQRLHNASHLFSVLWWYKSHGLLPGLLEEYILWGLQFEVIESITSFPQKLQKTRCKYCNLPDISHITNFHTPYRSIVGVRQIPSLSLCISTVLLVDSFSIPDSYSFSLPIFHRFFWPFSILSPGCCSISIFFLFLSLLFVTFASISVHFLYLFL